MPVIAVVNRKGGSGKSTLAAHIAAWCARNGSSVMLGDVCHCVCCVAPEGALRLRPGEAGSAAPA